MLRAEKGIRADDQAVAKALIEAGGEKLLLIADKDGRSILPPYGVPI